MGFDDKRWQADTLMLQFVIACSSGCSAVSIEGVGNVDEAGGIVVEVAVVVVVDGKIIVIDIVVAVAAGIIDDAAVADFVVVADVDGVGVFNVGTGF